MSEKDKIQELRENGIREANLVKKDFILIVKTTLYLFLIMTFILIILSIF